MDRMPIICAAGKPYIKDKNTVQSLLQIYLKDDLHKQTVNYARKEDPNHETYLETLQRKFPTKVIPAGDTVKKLIEPLTEKFRFTEFEESFFENLYYQSAKRKPFACSASANTKPESITNENTTFGRTLPPSKPIFPPKKIEEKIKFKKRNLQYYYDAYDKLEKKKKIFSLDSVGRAFKACDDKELCIINTVRDDDWRRQNAEVGKALRRQDFEIDPNKSMGRPPYADKFRAKLLIQNIKPCPELLNFYISISYFNAKRIQLKHRRDFYFHDVLETLLKFDKEKTNELPTELIYKVFFKYNVILDMNRMKFALIYYKLADSEMKMINYEKLLKFLNCSYPLPSLTGIIKLPEVDPTLETSYREFSTDLYRYPKECMEEPVENLHAGKSVVHLSELGHETNMTQILSPSIETQFGLSHRDYFLPRDQDEIKFIFRKIIDNLSDDDFKEIWDEAKTLVTSSNEKVSIEAFKCVFDKFQKIQELKKQEA